VTTPRDLVRALTTTSDEVSFRVVTSPATQDSDRRCAGGIRRAHDPGTAGGHNQRDVTMAHQFAGSSSRVLRSTLQPPHEVRWGAMPAQYIEDQLTGLMTHVLGVPMVASKSAHCPSTRSLKARPDYSRRNTFVAAGITSAPS
jgi:hypothetical protein